MWCTAAVVSHPASGGRSFTARAMTSSARSGSPERFRATARKGCAEETSRRMPRAASPTEHLDDPCSGAGSGPSAAAQPASSWACSRQCSASGPGASRPPARRAIPRPGCAARPQRPGDAVELECPLQVQGGEVALPHRLVPGLATVLRADGVGRLVPRQGQLVEPQIVIAEATPVGVLGDHAVLDAESERDLGVNEILQDGSTSRSAACSLSIKRCQARTDKAHERHPLFLLPDRPRRAWARWQPSPRRSAPGRQGRWSRTKCIPAGPSARSPVGSRSACSASRSASSCSPHWARSSSRATVAVSPVKPSTSSGVSRTHRQEWPAN